MIKPDYCYSCNITDSSGVLASCAACGTELRIAPGTVLSGANSNFTITGFIGKGGMGTVYEATDSISGDVVAVKQMIDDPDAVIQAENLKRFKLEADIQGQVNSPFYPKGFGYFEESGSHFMAMEFVSGEDLNEVLKKAPGKKLPEIEVLTIGVQLCEAINVMHDHKDSKGQPAPLLHRDIKPDNINRLAGSQDIKVLDFGIARPEKQSQATMLRVTSIGTREYVSLEQFLGNPVRQSDQYSIAATLYRLVTGQFLPGDFDDRLNAVSNLPGPWQPIFRKVLNKDPKLRYHSVMAFGQELANLMPAGMRPASFTTIPPPAPIQNVITPPNTPTANPITAPSSPVSQSQVGIQFTLRRSGVTMINAGEYQEAIGGRVLENGKPLGGVNIIPILMDMGGIGAATGNPGKTVQTTINGDFDLSIADLIVPVTASKRQVELVVEDSNTGVELYREILVINRPFSAGYSKVVGGFFGSIAAPFRWLNQKYQNRKYVKQAMQQAQLVAQQAVTPLQVQFQSAQAQANVNVQQAIQNAQNQVVQQQIVAKQSPDYVSFGQHLWNFLKPLLLFSLLGFVGFLAYELYITTDWKVWGPFALKVVIAIFIVSLILFFSPKIYRLGKRQHWGTVIKGWFPTISISNPITPTVVKIVIIIVLLFVMLFAVTIQQAWLIFMSIALILLAFGFERSYIMYIRLILAFFLGGIAIITWL